MPMVRCGVLVVALNQTNLRDAEQNAIASGAMFVYRRNAMTSLALAHTREDGATHALNEHLEAVAQRAQEYAGGFGGGEQAAIAGLWHDLGKYARDFQDYLRAASGPQAHIETDAEVAARKKVDHSSAGALHAALRSQEHGLAVAFAIAGHHAGLADFVKLKGRLADKQPRLDAAIAGGAPAELLARDVPALPASVRPAHARDHDALRRFELFTRMLFSALCDADFLDTEAFFDASRAQLRSGGILLPELARRISAHVDQLTTQASKTEVNTLRSEIRLAALNQTKVSPGIFTLTVPTGGGKTLTAMEFALHHAVRHGLRRVIVALPFTAILEQSADVYRRAFDVSDQDLTVLEHHATLDPLRETPQSRVACENWDAPIIVTTNVQLLESLFARRTSKCRKLHHITRSVIVLDEAQTLPRGFVAPTTDMLEALVRNYGCSIVLCTATQPALSKTLLHTAGFTQMTEIAPDPRRLADALRRVEVDWSLATNVTDYQTLADHLADENDVLAIVHRRDDAKTLVRAIDARTDDASTVHLSAFMCPAHRRERLAEIHARKKSGEGVRVVATQLVEAGVDLDFPVVYRALAGIDALTQAAGRCNREGKLGRLGVLRVFRAETEPPPGILRQALDITELMLKAGPIDLFDPATHTKFFSWLYTTGGADSLDTEKIQSKRAEWCFEYVAEKYRLIDQDWAESVVIPWDDRARKAIQELRMLGPSRARLRELARVTVTVNRKDVDLWRREKLVEDIADGTATVLLDSNAYDARFGLDPERVGLPAPSALIV